MRRSVNMFKSHWATSHDRLLVIQSLLVPFSIV
jgi:hypothetical protein